MSSNNKKSRSSDRARVRALAFGTTLLALGSALAPVAAVAQENYPLAINASGVDAANPPLTAPGPYKGYVSAMIGDGMINGAGAIGHRSMRARAAEIRMGHTIDPFGWVASGNTSATDAPRLDLVYINEGHPDNNHRDGYAIQYVYRKTLSAELGLELGAGPYYSQNRTTTASGEEINDSRLGALLSAALIARLDAYSPGLHMRVGFNHVAAGGGVPSSNALLVGLGKEIGAQRTESGSSDPTNGHPLWLGGSYGFAQTNHSGPGRRTAYSLETKQYFENFAWSLSAIDEGSDGQLVDRRGIAAQAWYVQPVSEKWSLSGGAGPYVARNKLDGNGTTLNALVTIQVDRTIGKDWKAFGNFGRVITFRDKNDADLITIGLMRSFGG